jgi:hypothetical protein
MAVAHWHRLVAIFVVTYPRPPSLLPRSMSARVGYCRSAERVTRLRCQAARAQSVFCCLCWWPCVAMVPVDECGFHLFSWDGPCLRCWLHQGQLLLPRGGTDSSRVLKRGLTTCFCCLSVFSVWTARSCGRISRDSTSMSSSCRRRLRATYGYVSCVVIGDVGSDLQIMRTCISGMQQWSLVCTDVC